MKFKKTIAVVDDEVLFRRGFIALMEQFRHIEVMFEAENGKDLFEKLKVRKPDVIFLDIEMPVMDGIEATVKVRERYPDMKIIILTSYASRELMFSLIEKGANAFLSKNTDIRTVSKAMNTVIEKGYYFDYEVSQAMVSGIVSKSKVAPIASNQKLSCRELEVLKLICRQLTNREIADTLCLSPRTIDTYRENIFEKTGSKNAVGVALYAIKHNILEMAHI